MITTKEEFEAEMQKALIPLAEALKKAKEEIFQGLVYPAGRNLHREMQEYHERTLALPVNLRRLVSFGIELSLAERFFEKEERDLSDEEAYHVQLALKSRLSFSTDDLQEMGRLMSEELRPKPIKQIPQGIPWNKKRDFRKRK